ncbi:hypothetical protein Poli38472_014064 [Pythium oligandrum]|uniref:Lectin n=1 Tax=Pythium oligandrum TaxID=41045 RepID=A0A8K1FPB5_PYTOL|nr:hypothetical protein Poli38472_014064 [Pythium oligandrum]|eukprot:TMW66752.1 hypothetical protein Poli38472_014064 [Pythium oligandrum]
MQMNSNLVQILFDGRSVCGVAPANTICNDDVFVGRSIGDPQWRQLPGKLKQISSDGKQICGVNAANDIWCAGDGIFSNPNWRMLPGKLKQVSLADGVLYGIGPDDMIWYGMSDGEDSFQRVSGTLRQIAYDGEMLCGTNAADEIWCSDNGLQGSPNWRRLPGKLRQLDVQGGRSIGVSGDTNIYHKWLTQPPGVFAGWRQLQGKLRQLSFDGKTFAYEIFTGNAVGAVNRVKLPGNLKMISTDGKQICGVSKDDDIYCADTGITSNPNWRQIPGKLKHVVVLNGVLFGTNSADDIFTGRSKGDPKWLQLEGKLKMVDYDGVRGKPNWYRTGTKLSYVTSVANRVFGANSTQDIYTRVDF